jgi:hypothetical protein
MVKLRRSDIIGWKIEYAAPMGLNFFLVWFYKDAAPTALKNLQCLKRNFSELYCGDFRLVQSHSIFLAQILFRNGDKPIRLPIW